MLAKEAHRRGDADLALQRYLYYVTRFPDSGFHTLEAYGSLVDVYFSTARSAEAAAMLGELHQVAQGTLDWEGQLNAARQLHQYQQEELADATFSLGFAAALAHLGNVASELEKIRVHVEIARYAADCDLANIALEHASAGAVRASALDRGPLIEERRDDLDRLHALALLIVVRANQSGQEPAKVVHAASEFLMRFPQHRDRDYINWHLGRALESQGKNKQAAEAYRRVGGAFRGSAAARLEALR